MARARRRWMREQGLLDPARLVFIDETSANTKKMMRVGGRCGGRVAPPGRAAEQERADVARARRRWMREQGMFDPARLVFIDETAANTKMVRPSGRCARGERLVGRVPHGHWKTITFVGALRRNGMTAPCVIDGAMKAERRSLIMWSSAWLQL